MRPPRAESWEKKGFREFDDRVHEWSEEEVRKWHPFSLRYNYYFGYIFVDAEESELDLEAVVAVEKFTKALKSGARCGFFFGEWGAQGKERRREQGRLGGGFEEP